MSTRDLVLADLAAESAELDALVSGVGAGRWDVVTTPEGWTVAHQIVGQPRRADILDLLDPPTAEPSTASALTAAGRR